MRQPQELNAQNRRRTWEEERGREGEMCSGDRGKVRGRVELGARRETVGVGAICGARTGGTGCFAASVGDERGVAAPNPLAPPEDRRALPLLPRTFPG